MLCTRCSKPNCTLLCSGCHAHAYCGDACADADWTRHYESIHTPLGVHTADLVIPGVYIGGIESLSDPDIMLHVHAIVSCIKPNVSEELLLQSVLRGRPLFRVPVRDRPDAPIQFYWPGASDFIDTHVKKGHTVLVHCHAGISRSVSTVIYYMLHKLGYKTADEALEHIQRARPAAGPNEGFMKRLRRSQ